MPVNVVVIGDVSARLAVRTPRFPRPHQTVSGDGFRQMMTGVGVLQAVAAARLGASVTLVGAVGDDVNAVLLREQLSAENVTAAFTVLENAATGVHLSFVEEAAREMSAYAPGANDRLTGAHVKAFEAAIATADLLITSLTPPHDAVERAFQIARDNDTLTLLKPTPVDPVSDRLLSLPDVLTPNEQELRALARHEISASPPSSQINVCTLAAAGAQWFRREDGEMKTGRVSRFQVRPVDPSGAGAVFGVALGIRMVEGASLEEAVRFANAAGAQAVTQVGEWQAAPSRDAVEALLTPKS